MNNPRTTLSRPARIPPLENLGRDLLGLTARQRWLTVARPFGCAAAFAVFASLGWWPPAVLAVAAYTFFSYGSTSHDLVHGNLGLSRRLSRILLSLIEILGLRSGHAYKAAHLHHHAHFPHADDVEAAAAHGPWWAALLAGPLHQSRIWWWALRHARHERVWIVLEGIGCAALLAIAIAVRHVTPIPLVYVTLVVLGSWTFPLITAYLPHDPHGADALTQTRRFRGTVAAVAFGQHLYHLEHHLYPRVPHHHWPTLARRLDPYLDRAGVKSIYFGG